MEKKSANFTYLKTELYLKIGDITTIAADAIVNAANSALMGGGGVDGAIHKAGGPEILKECRMIIKNIGQCKAGEAVITNSGNLPCDKIIHTVGPIYKDGQHGEPTKLASCYKKSLSLAAQHNLSHIAFPSISTGVYRYPLEEAALIALRTIIQFIENNPEKFDKIGMVLFNLPTYLAYEKALKKIMKEKKHTAS